MSTLEREVRLEDVLPSRRHRAGFHIRNFFRNQAYAIYNYNPEGIIEPVESSYGLQKYIVEHAQPTTEAAQKLVEDVTVQLRTAEEK
jgi:hypothetical protein